MKSPAIILLTLVAACGGGGTAGPDAASTSHDASSDTGPIVCTKHTTVFLNNAGGTYNSGTDDSRANTGSLFSGTTTVAAYPNADWADVKACVVAGLAGLPFDVTDVDPGTAPHLEIVFTTTFNGSTNAPGVTTGSCQFNPNAIAIVAGSVGTGAAYHCGVALGLVGVIEGLSYTNDAHDFMSFDVCTTGCSFKSTDETCANGGCLCGTNPTTEDPAIKMNTCR